MVYVTHIFLSNEKCLVTILLTLKINVYKPNLI